MRGVMSDNRKGRIWDRLQGLRETPAITLLNRFVYTQSYVIVIAILAAISNIFSTELFVYPVYIMIGLFLSLFAKDYLPLIPIVICCYIAPSVGNNPGRNPDSIFYLQNGGIALILMAAVLAASIIFRLWIDPEIGGKIFFRYKRKLLPGILTLGGAYLLSGIGTASYRDHVWNNLLFALIQIASILVPYYFFTGAVRWNEAFRNYFACTGLAVGAALMLEIGNIYLNGDIFVDGAIARVKLYTGWGIHNNIGALLAMMIPFAFHYAYKRTHSWRYVITGTAFFLGVVLTCSRGSILFAALLYCVCFAAILLKGKNKRANVIAFLGIFLPVVICIFIFRDELLYVFRDMLSKKLDPQWRDVFYVEGFKQYLKYPIFGGSFFPIEFSPWDWAQGTGFSGFFPPRWHNTVIQLLACCGVVGILSYAYPRYLTLILFWGKPAVEKTMSGFSILVLLGTSLVDCHFFNVGPTLFYSMGLAFAERIWENKR